MLSQALSTNVAAASFVAACEAADAALAARLCDLLLYTSNLLAAVTCSAVLC